MDYQATTPVDRRVVDVMLPYLTDKFGNPHSRSHNFGWESEKAVEVARQHIAALIKAAPGEIIFTSGATEANNLAIKGIVDFYSNDKKNHIITVTTEHKCVINTCRYLEQNGIKVTYLPVNSNGLIELNSLNDAINDSTIMVSISAVNNEIGVIQPIEAIGEICREKKIFFHTDIAQAFGKISIDVNKYNIDLASISAHKIYGPKGIGALYIRKRPRIRITPIIHGGGQERGMRSGTVPTHLVVGFGEAARIANIEMFEEYNRIQKMFNKFVHYILNHIPQTYLNGDAKSRYPGNVNISFACVEGESLILALKDLAISSGSACTSASLEPSYVLKAMGVDEDLAHTSLRFGFGRFTTEEEVNYAISLITEKVDQLRAISPLWEMIQKGIDIKKINWSVH
ncbi:cysteine desulfurase IscS [Orientia chuto str. Dubai]|uniref:Cysteine desulfurase IscS n=2 Tax=Candidatus Orientia mediorientalis TaxID=911112 RepID=A0A0F3MNL2_9RICK|nr:cysteine desulfurase IscS [Orientia chuto str. Dubai]